MKITFDPETQMRIRQMVKPGDPWSLDQLTDEICGENKELRRKFGDIVADEYRRRLSAMSREEMRELYRRCYEEPSDANKDWLLGEIVESIEARNN